MKQPKKDFLRLESLLNSGAGFKIALKDLEIRGAGISGS